MFFRTLVVLLTCVVAGFPQQGKVDPRNTYQRIICVVPMVGKGTPADPMRPKYAPWPPKSPTLARTEILSFSHQASDDGKFALVEFVARDRAAFAEILKDKSIKVFEKGKDKKEEADKELKKFKRDYDSNKAGMVHP